MRDVLKSLTNPEVVIIAGSGLSTPLTGVVVENVRKVPYQDIPELPQSLHTVPGHSGELVTGLTQSGVPVWVFAGRFHTYQNLTAAQVATPVKLAAEAGAELLITTNAAGTTQQQWNIGDLVGIVDHVNATGKTPLDGAQFVDLTDAYSPELLRAAHHHAHSLGITWREGVYAATIGPAYETAAEVKWLQTAGVDLVGMSTVHETITARALGLEVFGVSVVTNRATGVAKKPHHHDMVVKNTEKVAVTLPQIVTAIINESSWKKS